MCCSAFSQSSFPEFDKAREIKLLESTPADVESILSDFKSDFAENSAYYRFVTKNAIIEIHYSSGYCSDKSTNLDVPLSWDIPKRKVTEIFITPKKEFRFQSLEIDYSKFKRDRLYINVRDSYVYYDKNSGIAFEIINNIVDWIILIPPKEKYLFVCKNELTKKFYTSQEWFTHNDLKHRIREHNGFADVIELKLSKTEISAYCQVSDSQQDTNCKKISVDINAIDPENDVLTFRYEVSGGKIVGQGAKVIWDLSGVEPGTYTIAAGVDDGCGLCGETKKRTVVVKSTTNTP